MINYKNKLHEAVNLDFCTNKSFEIREKGILKSGYIQIEKKEFLPVSSKKSLKSMDRINYDSDSNEYKIVKSFDPIELFITKKGLPTKSKYFNPSGFYLEIQGNWAHLIGGKSEEEVEKELSRIEKAIISNSEN